MSKAGQRIMSRRTAIPRRKVHAGHEERPEDGEQRIAEHYRQLLLDAIKRSPFASSAKGPIRGRTRTSRLTELPE